MALSEYRAYNFILVARKASGIEKLQRALKNKSITLSKAKRISSVVNAENIDHWLSQSQVLSQRGLERAVAKENPKFLVQEGSRFISENILELKVALSLETEKRIKRVQDLLCQSRGKSVSFDETLNAMAEVFLDKNDPVLKADGAIKRKLKSDLKERATKGNLKDKSLRLVNFRKPLPSFLKHKVILRDFGQCQKRGTES